MLVPNEFKSAAGASGAISADGVVAISGTLAKDTFTVKTALPTDVDVKFIVLEALADPSLPAGGPGRARRHRNFVITNFAAAYSLSENAETAVPLKLVSAKADAEQSGFAASGAIDDKADTGWGTHACRGRDARWHSKLLAIVHCRRVPALLTITIEQQRGDTQSLCKFRLSVVSELRTSSSEAIPERQQLVAERERAEREMLSPIPLAIAVQEGGMRGGLFSGIQDVPIHLRGSYAKLGPVVPRHLPRFSGRRSAAGNRHGEWSARWRSGSQRPTIR